MSSARACLSSIVDLRPVSNYLSPIVLTLQGRIVQSGALNLRKYTPQRKPRCWILLGVFISLACHVGSSRKSSLGPFYCCFLGGLMCACGTLSPLSVTLLCTGCHHQGWHDSVSLIVPLLVLPEKLCKLDLGT